ncbi:ferritin-like domain-containing protein [Winogradskyella flava]|uniref:Ferritin-like protein n=1 Tax=Winogradskyella flava TaxID=1884876 RepID=A0A842ITK0_9FLAO|nr:ferritin-like protein [Winogradskyella flava]MBC2845073.1 ferritin-like protein [Winogradskyella flava]
MKYKHKAETRSDILTLLCEASEIEHGLACSYLFTAFSLKCEVDESLKWEQLHMVKKWAAQIFFVASEEMLHLAQVWNLLTAIGGTPYYARPNFPLNAKYYHFDIPISLNPFSVSTMKRFKMYELPRTINEKDYVKTEFGLSFEDSYDYKTVGDLYAMIKEGIKSIPEEKLFIGDKDIQIGSDVIDFPDIIKVTDRKTSLEAIDQIMEQGEGTEIDEENSHYWIFSQILSEFEQEIVNDNSFNPVKNIIENPVVFNKGDIDINNANILQNESAILISDLFDDLYVLMMQILQHVFLTSNKKKSRELGKFAIHMMPIVIKPLADCLSKIPAGSLYKNKTASPSFTINRHVQIPSNYDIAIILINERLAHLIERSEFISKKYDLPEEFYKAIKSLKSIKP